MRLSVVVPCYNEEMVIESFDAKTRALLDSLPVDYEICYVDDGSSDRTLDLLRALAKKNPAGLRYTSFSRNFGKEAAMLAGLREATGDAVVIMDADLQHPPELIGRMLELHAVGHDQVIARRDRSGESRLRKALGKAYYRMVNRWVDVELVDGVGDFRLLSRRAVNALLSMPEQNRFSKGLFSWIGFDTVTFDYTNVAREAGETKWRFGALVNYGVDGLISFNNRPLRVAIHLGLLLAGLATLYAAWTVVSTLAFGVRTPGYATLLAAIVGMGGAQMVMLGLVGEYIGRIYYETKRRPHFLVKETNASGADSASPIRTRSGATEAGAVASTGVPLSATWNRTVGQ
ncbi:glycosyltransferase family 2 protein [Streptomyces candidus]|nr:glycosyltransferase family 2 protein [Streptomyces candidus]GHH47610.1 glycosyl transferase [Streptomyces candidus]